MLVSNIHALNAMYFSYPDDEDDITDSTIENPDQELDPNAKPPFRYANIKLRRFFNNLIKSKHVNLSVMQP